MMLSVSSVIIKEDSVCAAYPPCATVPPRLAQPPRNPQSPSLLCCRLPCIFLLPLEGSPSFDLPYISLLAAYHCVAIIFYINSLLHPRQRIASDPQHRHKRRALPVQRCRAFFTCTALLLCFYRIASR